MITPISSSSYSSKGLEPVKIPTFCGQKVRVTGPIKATKQDIGDTVSFKQQTKDFLNATRQGAIKSYTIAKNGIKKGAEFTTSFFDSLFKDTVNVAKTRGARTLTRIDNIGDGIGNMLT